MKPTERDLMVARAVWDAFIRRMYAFPHSAPSCDVDVAALLESLPEPADPRCRYCSCAYCGPRNRGEVVAPEPAEPEQAAETERFARIGKLFCELWEAGAPWPVRHWSCDKHKVKGCLRCKTTTAPMVVP